MEVEKYSQQVRIKFPARINVSIQLDGDLKNQILHLNRLICSEGFGEIDFNSSLPQIPHATLLMGEVRSRSEYESLLLACADFASDQQQFPYSISLPYLRSPSKKFVFVDTLPEEKFYDFRRLTDQYVGAYIECDFYGGPDNGSHITIGYSNIPFQKIQLLKDETSVTQGTARNIQICLTGRRGSCTDLLEEYSLNESVDPWTSSV